MFLRSSVTSRGAAPPHNRTAPGIPHPAAHTSHKLPHWPGTAGFCVGLPNSACSGVSWAPGWERTAGPKAGDARKGIEGLPAAHWAVSGIKTTPDFKKYHQELSSDLTNAEKLGIEGCQMWTCPLEYTEFPDLAIQHSQPGSSRHRGERFLDLQQQEHAGSSPCF